MADLEPAAAEELLRAGLGDWEGAWLTVSGDCLEPHVRDGERVRLVAPSRRGARFGDVVLARQTAGLRLHRLVWPPPGLRAANCRTKADRSACLDAPIRAEAVLAVVAGVERDGALLEARSASRALRSLAGWLALRLGLGSAG